MNSFLVGIIPDILYKTVYKYWRLKNAIAKHVDETGHAINWNDIFFWEGEEIFQEKFLRATISRRIYQCKPKAWALYCKKATVNGILGPGKRGVYGVKNGNTAKTNWVQTLLQDTRLLSINKKFLLWLYYAMSFNASTTMGFIEKSFYMVFLKVNYNLFSIVR